MRKSTVSLIILIVSILGLAACSTTNDASHMGMQNDEYDGNAVMFAQMMIPHHEQAVQLSKLALKNSTNAEVLDLAARIKKAQSPEIIQMQGWLEAVGMPDMNHVMEMPGYVDDSHFSKIKKLTGKDFDLLFLKLMIGHHEGAIEMASDIKNNKNDEVKALSVAITTSQSAEISEMEGLLEKLS